MDQEFKITLSDLEGNLGYVRPCFNPCTISDCGVQGEALRQIVVSDKRFIYFLFRYFYLGGKRFFLKEFFSILFIYF